LTKAGQSVVVTCGRWEEEEEFGGHHQRGKHTCLGGQLGPAANAFDTFQASGCEKSPE